MTSIEKRLDAIIELLVLLVNQTERKAKFPNSFQGSMVLDKVDFPKWDTIFRQDKELLEEAAAAVEAVRQDSLKRQEPQRKS